MPESSREPGSFPRFYTSFENTNTHLIRFREPADSIQALTVYCFTTFQVKILLTLMGIHFGSELCRALGSVSWFLKSDAMVYTARRYGKTVVLNIKPCWTLHACIIFSWKTEISVQFLWIRMQAVTFHFGSYLSLRCLMLSYLTLYNLILSHFILSLVHTSDITT